MLKSCKQKLSKQAKKPKKDLTMWDEAISDIQVIIKGKKDEIRRLSKDIRTLEVLRDSGMAFPEPPEALGAKADET